MRRFQVTDCLDFLIGAGRVLIAALTLTLAVFASPLQAQQLSVLRIGGQSPPIFEFVFWHYAIEYGFLKRYGIDAKFTGFSAGVTMSQALAGGSIDVSCDGVSGTIGAMAQGVNNRIVLMINADNTYVVLSKESIATPADLRGKKWAITQMGAISQTYAALWLEANGIRGDRGGDPVEWIPVGGTASRIRAIVAGQVDASLISVGDWLRIKNEKGLKRLASLPDTLPPLPFSTCAVPLKLINERPDLVQGYVSGMIDAVRHARTPEGKQQYLKLSQGLNQAKLSEKDQDELYEYYLGPNGNAFAIDPNGGMYPEVLPVNIKMMVADKTLKTPLPSIRYGSLNSLPAISPRRAGSIFAQVARRSIFAILSIAGDPPAQARHRRVACAAQAEPARPDQLTPARA